MQKKQPFQMAAFFVLILSLLLCSGTGYAAEEDAEKSRRYITIDFENVDIHLFIKYISELTGKNFIVDRSVQGNVTIVSPTKISEEEAYRVFESVLDVHGYTTVKAGAVIKIIPTVKARSENIRTFRSGMAGSAEDQMVTQLIPLKHTTPDEIKKVLAPLVSKTSVVIAHTQSGMLIVTETLSNIQRLIAIIEAIDVAYTGEEIVVLPLQYASSTTISRVLTTLFQKSKGTAAAKGARPQAGVEIVPYERINALIVVAPSADVERVRNLVKLLDSEMERDSGNIHVIYLQNANAEEMAKVLTSLPGQQSGDQAKGKAPTISKDVNIMADEETNSLIITASRNEFNTLEEVIKKLDIPRRMVYLEALILEVQTTKDFEVGVEWRFGEDFGSDSTALVSGFTGSNSTFDLLGDENNPPPPSASGLTFGVVRQGIKIGGITFPNIGAILRAYKNDSDINIVSTPQILTTDNKKAEISVGENVPYITSQNTTASEQDYTSYEYRDVSTKLTITPQINQAETLRLEIATEVIKLKDNTNNTPTTFKRTAETTVIVKDNETVVIGGIIGQDSTDATTKVPLLGDIPLLGYLFRADSELKTQTNMFIFITPRIIKNPADLTGVTLNKERQMGKVMPEIKKDLFREVNASHAVRLAELGFAEMKENDYKEAKEYFYEALEIDPENPYALYNLGVIYESEGNREAAKESYQRVILTGTGMKAAEATEPSAVGLPLLQLARERMEVLRQVEVEQMRRHEEERSK